MGISLFTKKQGAAPRTTDPAIISNPSEYLRHGTDLISTLPVESPFTQVAPARLGLFRTPTRHHRAGGIAGPVLTWSNRNLPPLRKKRLIAAEYLHCDINPPKRRCKRPYRPSYRVAGVDYPHQPCRQQSQSEAFRPGLHNSSGLESFPLGGWAGHLAGLASTGARMLTEVFGAEMARRGKSSSIQHRGRTVH